MPVTIANIELFLLVFIRIAGALAVLPVFGHRATPVTVKTGLAALIALMLVPSLAGQLPTPSGSLLDFFLLAFKETLCGIILGFAGQFLFYAVEIAGQLVGFQAGFSIVASIDPNTETQATVLTQFYNLTALLIFVTIDGHHTMIRAVADSLHAIPVGKLAPGNGFVEWSFAATTQVLGDGIRLAAPLMVTLLLADVGLGILTRIAPTLNVFVLGFPLKIALSLIMISLTLTVMASVFTHQYTVFTRELPGLLKLLAAP